MLQIYEQFGLNIKNKAKMRSLVKVYQPLILILSVVFH